MTLEPINIHCKIITEDLLIKTSEILSNELDLKVSSKHISIKKYGDYGQYVLRLNKSKLNIPKSKKLDIEEKLVEIFEYDRYDSKHFSDFILFKIFNSRDCKILEKTFFSFQNKQDYFCVEMPYESYLNLQ